VALELDPVLLEVLVCPDDHHAPLRTGTPSDPEAAALTCSSCGRIFPVRDGIPIMLLDEATPPVSATGQETDDSNLAGAGHTEGQASSP
jgi:uncharacterized protein YbaR (Trm112 family)